MIKKHYLIATDIEHKLKFIKVEGYIKQAGNFWFGINKPEGSEGWTITDLSTGRRVTNVRTLKECEQQLPECVFIMETCFNGSLKEVYRAWSKICEEAYLKNSDAELTDVFWKITGDFH